MRTLTPKLLLAAALASGALHQAASAQTLLEKTFRVGAESEALLDLTAAAPGASWVESGKEAAVATLYVDGRYHQDVILFAGSRTFTYPVMLGHLAPGNHTLRVEFNRQQSAAKASTIEIKDAKISTVGRSQAEYQALALAPIIYARPNTIGRFSDIPLLMWYEVERDQMLTTIRYSLIFSNEDGGTQTNALMARWGRTTDIEWVYEAQLNSQGKLVAAIFQGVDHQTRQFQGKKEADHPLFSVASDNNNFSDDSQSEMRFAPRPIPFDLSHASREELMDRHPWTYQIMAEELQREGKINESSRVGQQIADPRHYLYLEAAAKQQGTAMSFAVKLKGDRKWYTSDLGINYYKIDRNGYFRTTVRLPAGVTMDKIERLAVRCDVAGDPRSRAEMNKVANAECELTAVNKVFLLDEHFQPGPSLPLHVPQLKLQFGEMVELYDGHAPQGRNSQPHTKEGRRQSRE